MAQPGRAPQYAPKVIIRVKNGVPDQDSVAIQIGEMAEFHNEDNLPYEIPLSFLIGGSDEDSPLAGYLPAGGKFGVIGTSDSTCEYTVNALSEEASRGVGGGPPYTIIVGSGLPKGDS